MTSTAASCPFKVGDSVVFAPSGRTRGLYQDIRRLGVLPGETVLIAEIREGTYLHFKGGAGGWPWNEFVAAGATNTSQERRAT